jgi:UDP-N-acetylmuramoyl-tripeptide--D-alanyl-D-alanine ligase
MLRNLEGAMTTTEQLYTLFLQHPLISTDTRKILPGSMFFALKGEKFDANTFAEKAIEAGAVYVVIDNATYQLNEKYLLVDDVLTALQDLARHHRKQLKIPVIGLTGTNGKTTTKELINSVLSQHFKTKATQGNLNNHIGVPLTILTVDETHEIAVIEMGANHQKEIALLCSIAQPTHGLITNVGKAHLEGFGGVEGVKKGKGELYDFLKATGGTAFVNTDSYELIQMQLDRDLDNVYNYGTRSDINFVYGRLTENGQFLSLKWKRNKGTSDKYIKTHLTGAYNLGNILAAICIGAFFKLTDDEINRGVTGYQPQNNRSQITQTTSNTLICDYYNANPSSMMVAIENIGKMKADKKVLILGDMFELGDEAAAEHLAIIKKTMETPADARIFIGKEFTLAAKSMDHGPWTMDGATFYETAEDAINALKAKPIKNATVLIKGSRGMALERLVELF